MEKMKITSSNCINYSFQGQNSKSYQVSIHKLDYFEKKTVINDEEEEEEQIENVVMQNVQNKEVIES